MVSKDPKHAALLEHGFSWVPEVGVWLHEHERKIVSDRAVREWELNQLLNFINLRSDQTFQVRFSRSA